MLVGMRFCEDHWTRLRGAIDMRGLSHLVAPDGHVAAQQMAQEVQAGPSPVTYDPLMAAHWAIVSNATKFVGLALLMPNDDGSERCPLCFVTSQHLEHCQDPGCTVKDYDSWIDRAADDQAAHVATLGA